MPRIEGAETFTGHTFHSARWDHAYELAGKRVAVVGTGASAVQLVPEIAGKVQQLTVFQRTGNWFLPRKNRRYPEAFRALIEHAPALQELRRRFIFNYCEMLTMAIRHPNTIGRLVGAALSGVHALAAPRPRAAPQGLAGLHIRLQARAVQLLLSARAGARERRARQHPDPPHDGDRDRHSGTGARTSSTV